VRVTTGGSTGNATIGFQVTDSAGVTTTGGKMTLVVTSLPEDSTAMLITIVIILGAVMGVIGMFGCWRASIFLKAAIRAKAQLEAEEIARCRRAVNAARTIESTLHMVNLKSFKAMGKITTHEDAREKGFLVHVDNYDELITFVAKNPVAFISHQWLSWGNPDPDLLQFNNMVGSLEALCKEHGYSEESLHIFLDYTSIPQKNVTARINAINSLGVFSSLAQHFIIIAPSAKHKDTGLICDKATYQRRGWCRLEQWGHMCMWGMNEMYFYNMETGKNEALGEDAQWKYDSIMVFEGDYTNPDNKKEMVDVVLGLYGMVLQSKEGVTKDLFQLLESNDSRVFPAEYFHGLATRLHHLYDNDPELRSILADAAAKVAGGAAERKSKMAARQGDTLEA